MPDEPKSQSVTYADAGVDISSGDRAKQVFDQQAGATGRCVEALKEILSTQEGTEHPA